jgi:hypothetical protein
MMTMRSRISALVLCGLALLCSVALAQGPAEQFDLVCPTATSAVTVDGRLDEPAWQTGSRSARLCACCTMTGR